MATNSNVYSQGGGGVFYENEVQSGFFISFLLGLTIPGTQEGAIFYYRQQSGSLGYHTDDLLLHCVENGNLVRVLIQIKHNLVISANGGTFKEVIIAAWKDFKNDNLFDPSSDKIFIVKSDLTSDEKNHLKVILDWSRTKATSADFINEVSRIKAKKNYFDLVKNIVVATHPEDAIDDQQYVAFLRTLYILELDYGTDNSQNKAVLYSLINNYKTDNNSNAAQIWSRIASHLLDSNGKGGEFDKNNIPDEFKIIFNAQNYQREVKQLLKFSEQKDEILEVVEDTTGEYSLVRDDITSKVSELLNNNNVVVISGDPGTGKSAVAKTVVRNIQSGFDGFILIFKADEFGSGTLTEYFSRYNIHLTLKEIFSLFGLFHSNLIYIDAMEKLLEADGLAANQMLKAIKSIPNVKVLITCRKSNLGLIEMKYLGNLKYAKEEVSILTDAELAMIYKQVPVLSSLSSNRRLKSLMRIPKYLDFAYRAIAQSGQNFDNINEVDFKEMLWKTIIENRINENLDGLPERRSQFFIHIAVNRSKIMRPFTPITLDDPNALEKLIKENVVIKSNEGRLFVPAHDVLEDWALVKYVDECFRKDVLHANFFNDLGQEPSMRRAYRLWVQATLQDKQVKKLNYIIIQLFTSELDNYWRDESLIAILYSEYCTVFFEQYRAELVKNDYHFLFRLIQVMRTACRENVGNVYSKNYLPRGFGWQPVFELLLSELTNINPEHYDLVYQLIQDWSVIINSQDALPDGTRTAGLIMLWLFSNHISLNSYRNERADEAVQLLSLFAGGIHDELIGIIDSDKPEDNEQEEEVTLYGGRCFSDSDKFKNKLIKVALSGPPASQLCKYLPETVIRLANEHWLHKSCPVRYPENAQDRMIYDMSKSQGRSTDIKPDFGLQSEDRLEYFPGSAYQTPVLWLLRYHPSKALPFITELINWCTESYISSEFGKDDQINEITLYLPDDSTVNQYASDHLWQMFRGKGRVSPYLLQSILMALEKYLLELCNNGEANREVLNHAVDYLYRNSNSISTTAVIASICQAYPALTDNFISPLYSDHKFISFDISRYVNDRQSTFNTLKPLHDQERLASDTLPHRLKYEGGLRSFINSYCFNHGVANKQLFALLDKLRKNASPNDFQWLKLLDEMDIRTWQITKTIEDAEKVNYVIEPSYQEGIKEYVTDLKEEKARIDVSTNYFNWLYQVKKNEIKPDINYWREVYTYYSALETFSIMDHRPSMVAECGIRYLWEQLNDEEKSWCKQTIYSILEQKIGKSYRPFDLELTFSTIDFDSAMDIFPLITLLVNEDERANFEKLALYFLTAPFQENDPDAEDYYKAFKNDVWKLNKNLANKGLFGIIKFAEFYKSNSPERFRLKSEEEEQRYWDDYEILIDEIVSGTETLIEIQSISLETHSMFYLIRAIKILPDKTEVKQIFDFTEKIFNLYLIHCYKDKDDREYSEVNYQLKWAVEEKISNLIFWNQNKYTHELFEHFFKSSHAFIKLAHDSKKDNLRDIYKFFFGIAEKFINIADHHLPLDNLEETKHTVACFTATWSKFNEISQRLGSKLFASTILLNTDIGWRQDVTHWLPIDNQTEEFCNYIQHYGEGNLQSVVSLLSHIGDQTLLMPMLDWLIGKFKAVETTNVIMLIKQIEQLISRVYYNHLNELLDNKRLFENYLWLLDRMVEQQSSDAYWLREFIIHLNIEKLTIEN